jgi:NADPH:quinone reductase-like Zn-dependent oxidoreductase
LPELAPDEVFIAVMASSINFNTVWTSIFEPLSTFGFLDRLGRSPSGASATRSTTTSSGSDAAGVILRTGSAVRKWKVGDEVTVHCNYVDDQDPRATTTRCSRIVNGSGDSRPTSGAGRHRGRQSQSVDAQAHAPHLGGGGRQRPVQLDGLSDAGLAQRRAGDPGDKVLIWGASGGLGSFAVQHVLNSGGTPVGVVSSEAKVETLHELGCEYVIDRQENDYQFWKDEHTQDESEWRRLGKDIRASSVRTPTSSSSTRALHHGRERLRGQARRHHRHLRGDEWLHDRVRQSSPLDETQDHQGLALLQLPRGLGGEPDDHRRQGRAAALGGLPARRDRRGRLRRCTTTVTRARSACSARLPRRDSASRTRTARARRRGTPDHLSSTRLEA